MALAIVSGIISGVLSSAFVYFILFKIKPRVMLSNQICRDRHDNFSRIKLVNCSKADLVDLKYTLHYFRRLADGIAEMNEIPPCKSRLEFLDAYSKSDEYSDYAARISFDLSSLPPNSTLLFTFYAKHSVSGTAVFMRKEYDVSSIQCGKFETGKSTKIILESCAVSHFCACENPHRCAPQEQAAGAAK